MNKITIGNCDLWLGNSLDILPTLSFVDHVISDPPYEQEAQDRIGRTKRTDGGNVLQGLSFEGIDSIRDDVCNMTYNLNPKWRIFFCTVEGVSKWKKSMVGSGGKYKSSMIWNKPDAMPKMNGQGPAVAFECMALDWCAKGYSKWNGGGRRNVFTHNTNQPDRDGTHPCEKPLPLMMELIHLFTNPGDTVLDPFMGSGATGLACIKLGRKFIGIEKDKDYYDLAVRRIQAATGSGNMGKEVPLFDLRCT